MGVELIKTFMYFVANGLYMCYSKGVQLTTSLILLISTLIYYLYYSRKLKKNWQLSFLKTSMLVFLCIGLHQFFEYLSLLTNNTIIYKIGLIISICAVYFLLRSLEVLSNKKLYSWIALIPIALVSLQIIFSNMNFTEASFYLKHNSAFFWAATWLILFVYWHICASKVYSEIKNDNSKKTLLIYLLAIADTSFILSAIYVLVGYFLFSVNVCTDSPSIWCTFYALQTIFIPIIMFRINTSFNRPTKSSKITLRQVALYLLISLLVIVVLTLTLPFFDCLTWKFVFP